MKTLDRIALALFSSLILIFSVVLCLAIFGWIDTDLLGSLFHLAVTDSVTSKILLGLAIIFILLAIKCIFFDSTSKEQVDYLQIFNLTIIDGVLGIVEIEHTQEIPEYRNISIIKSKGVRINLKVYVIIESEYATMMLASEY